MSKPNGPVLDQLRARFGERIETGAEVRASHANTNTWLPAEPPDAVLRVRSEAEVQQAVAICAAHRFPIIAFGAGTSVEGAINAPHGGLSMDFSQMAEILAIHADDADAVVQPGVRRSSLNEALKPHRLFFAVDPGSDPSFGGMSGTRASGTNAAKYGTLRENVLALRVVLPDGSVIRTGGRARKSSAGYDLTRLFVGSEGTFGLVTELTVRLARLPRATASAVCAFVSVEAACEAARQAAIEGVVPARIELMDEVQVAASNRYSNMSLAQTPTLFLEFQGYSERSVEEQAEAFGSIAAACGASDFAWASTDDARAALWQARHNAFWADSGFRDGAVPIVTDVCVPVAALAECIAASKRDLMDSGLVAPILAHVGDGNFHCIVLVQRDDAEEMARAKGFVDRVVARALQLGGTSTGEHGVGQGKRRFLEEEFGEGAVALMRRIKAAVDPDGIMNPEKVV